MRLTDRDGHPWAGGEPLPAYLELDRDEDVRAAVREVPAEVLVDVSAEPWLSWGVEPPSRSVTDLRRELEQRAREALKDAPPTRLVPISEAAREWAIPERTLRARIARGALEPSWNGRGEMALEVPVTSRISVPLPRARRPDPRVFAWLGQESRLGRIRPGETFADGYIRRADGENWRTSW